MKLKILLILLLVSLIFNITFIWNYMYSNQFMNSQEMESSFSKIKSYIANAENNVDLALAADNVVMMNTHIYRVNRQLFLAYGEANYLTPILARRYLVNLSSLTSYLFDLQNDLAMVQEDLIENNFQSLSLSGREKLKRVNTQIKKLNELLMNKSLNRKDLRSINAEL